MAAPGKSWDLRVAILSASVAGWLLACGSGADRSGGEPEAQTACLTAGYTDEAAFNDVFEKACHNCYLPQASASFEHALDQARIVEIDIYDSMVLYDGSTLEPLSGNWHVRHDPWPGSESNCSAAGTFKDCLSDVLRWSEAHPDHDPITIYMDKKQEWFPGRQPAELDALVLATLSRERLFTPADLMGTFSSPGEAVTTQGWPRHRELRGKVLIVLTETNSFLSQYVAERGARALLFVGPTNLDEEDITGVADGFDEGTAQWVVITNLKNEWRHLAPLGRARKRLVRALGGATDEEYQELLGLCVNQIAMDRFDPSDFNQSQMKGVLVTNPHYTPAAQ